MQPLIRRKRRSDAVPSRWAWRIERLLLTPAFVLFLRVGIPMCVAFAAGTWWLSDEARRAVLVEMARDTRAQIESRPEFMVQLMAIDGVDAALAAEIRAEIPLEFPLTSFDLDLEAIRDRIVAMAPVETATVRIRPGGVLQIDAVPRVAVAVWRSRQGLALIDRDGIHVAELTARMDRPDLPLIAGVSADMHVDEALRLHRAALPLGPRLRGVVRIGERRWNVVLDRDQRILLPVEGAVEALERLIALDAAQDILARDIVRVDLRLGARPTVQMSGYATQQWWDIRQVSRQQE